MFAVYIICLVTFFILNKWRLNRVPHLPGPWGVPVLGSLPFLGRKANLVLTDYAKTYGPVYQVQVGDRRMVVVCGQSAIRDALGGGKGYDFAGRPAFASYAPFGVFGERGYLPHHRLCKRVTQRAMNMFDTAHVQAIGHAAVADFIARVTAFDGAPLDPKPLLSFSTWTIMGQLCYGHKFDINDEEVHDILSTAKRFGWATGLGVLYDYVPWTAALFGRQIKEMRELTERMSAQSRKLAARNYESWDGVATRTMADLMNKTVNELGKDDDSASMLTDAYMQKMLTELFGAGFGTTASMSRWALMLMAVHADVQRQCQTELDAVVGGDDVTLDDQTRLPLCMATLAEIYRFSSMSALGITHECIKDSHILGHAIPAGTPLIFNLYSAHYDDTVFDAPTEFNPWRYIDAATGRLSGAAVHLNMPYGLGLRRCGGESVAKQEIFLFFAMIMHRMSVSAPPGETLDATAYNMTLGLELKPFKLVFKPRL